MKSTEEGSITPALWCGGLMAEERIQRVGRLLVVVVSSGGEDPWHYFRWNLSRVVQVAYVVYPPINIQFELQSRDYKRCRMNSLAVYFYFASVGDSKRESSK